MFLFQDDFLEKNRKHIPKNIRLLIQKSTALFDENVILESKQTKSLKTLTSTLKFEVDMLIENLKKTVSIINRIN